MLTKALLFAPAFGGKGYTGNYISGLYTGKCKVLSTGELTRNRRKDDREFDQLCQQVDRTGDIIPDEIMLPMFLKEYEIIIQTAIHEIIVLDGIGRSPGQIRTLGESGFFKDTLFFNIDLTIETCEKRRQKAIAEGRRNSRTDNDIWQVRYRQHIQTRNEILSAVKDYAIKPILIDGNKELSKMAFLIAMRIRDRVPFPNSISQQL